MIRISLLLILLLSAKSVFASPLTLNYSLFFGYMKTEYKLQYEHVTNAFYLRDKKTGAACLIKQALIVVDQKREPIKFEKEGRLLPFFSDQHRKDGAMIEVELLKGQTDFQCDLQVTLMAKELELDNLSLPRLALISEQLEGLLKKNAGMVGKYFLPTFSGVRLKLAEPLSALQLSALDKQIGIAENGDLLLANSFLKESKLDNLDEFKVARITPWLVK
ncbi:DUF2987 domain-containing protein [Psychromonas sp.]|uniref:DUF2987 domain-containing protein n=1 Tax=Psychromonas sp. TaxID=1884585 RepID=UPI0039E44494